MKQENSQLDIPDRQLLASSAQPSVWTEIGEAQVTHTIFGRAKVRIIRKHDNVRRALWRTLVVVIIAVSAWQGWVAYQPSEPQQSFDSLPPASSSNPESAPALKPEIIAPAVTPLEVKSAPVAAAQTEIHKPMIVQKRAPQQPIGLNGAEQKPAKPVMAQPKPVTAQPSTANKPQTAPLTTNNNALKNPTDKPLSAKLSSTSNPVAPAVAKPRPALSAVQPAASSPAAVPTLTSPVKEDASTQSPTGEKQLIAPINAPTK